MKKIMFNDRYGLTKAVLEGRKTMTRRAVPILLQCRAFEKYQDEGERREYAISKAQYKPGEVVAVAQAYRDAINPLDWVNTLIYKNEPGWTNKMFVGADLMPHQIFINAVRVERLQDISDEDCLREGIREVSPLRSLICLNASTYQIDGPGCENIHYTSPRGAFAALIDKVSGKGTWASNPWVYVYEFELVK